MLFLQFQTQTTTQVQVHIPQEFLTQHSLKSSLTLLFEEHAPGLVDESSV